MNRILALFSESDTRDELGLGAIRDSFSDRLFPGTSTVHTRLRYMLFIPWMYLDFESRPDPSAQLARRGREFEVAMIKPLLDSEDQSGVVGKRAKAYLKTLPSTIYWAGLQSWGICLWRRSQGSYHARLDEIARGKKALRIGEDGALIDGFRGAWHANIPPAPSDFPKQCDFRLTREEAEFILDRLRGSCGGSLLSHLADNWDGSAVEYPWLHPSFADFSPANKELLNHARIFTTVMNGAALLYNHLLAVLTKRELDYVTKLKGWAVDLDFEELQKWRLDRFWELVESGNMENPLDEFEYARRRVGRGTRAFVEAWRNEVVNHGAAVWQKQSAKDLVERRERGLKGPRSRFVDSRVRDLWSGKSSVGLMGYRWHNALRFLEDLHSGLRGE